MNFYYFPTTIYHSIENAFLDNVRDVSQHYLNDSLVDDYSVYCTDNHIPYVKQSADVAQDPATSAAMSYFYSKCIDILNDSGYDTSLYDFFISAWFQEVNQYSQHDIHNHNESCMAGLYFFDVHDNGCYPVFYDPRREKIASSLRLKESDVVNTASDAINFKDSLQNGSFFIFESWLSHKITMNVSPYNTTKFLHFCLHHRRKINSE